MEHQWNDIDRAQLEYSENNCLNATLVTTSLTWPDLVLNPGLCSERPMTNWLSHGVALTIIITDHFKIGVARAHTHTHTLKSR